MSAVLAMAALGGCGSPTNPTVGACDGQTGTCLEIKLEGDVGQVDSIHLDLQGEVYDTQLVKLPGATNLPVAMAILLRPKVNGQVTIKAGAFLNGNPVARGVAVGTIKRGASNSAPVNMNRLVPRSMRQFSNSHPIDAGSGASFDGVAIADFDGDGSLDLLLSSENAPLTIWQNNGHGTFTSIFPHLQQDLMGKGIGTAIAIGDFNGDARPDVAVCAGHAPPDKHPLRRGWVFLGGTPDQVFLPDPYPLLTAGDYQTQAGMPTDHVGCTEMALGDFDADGVLDLAVGFYGVTDASPFVALTGVGTGTFMMAKKEILATNASGGGHVLAGDFHPADQSGFTDLTLIPGGAPANGPLDLFRGNGDGSFWRTFLRCLSISWVVCWGL